MCPPDRRDHQTWKSSGMVQMPGPHESALHYS